MKQLLHKWKQTAWVLLFLLTSVLGWGQTLLTDNFLYSGLLTDNSWVNNGGFTSNPLTTVSGLTYSGHAGSGIGNAVKISNLGGQDVGKTYTAQNVNGQTIYYSFLINVTESSTSKTGDYVVHLGGAGGTSWASFSSRFFVKVVSGNVNFGISNTSTATYSSINYSKNTTYFVIVKYLNNTSGNDSLSMWVLPSGIPSTEILAGTPSLVNNGTDLTFNW